MTEPTAPAGDCPVCAGAIDERERILCPRCETPHHRDCYGYNRGCAIFACNPDQPTTPVPKKGKSPGQLLPLPEFIPTSRVTQAALFMLATFTAFTAIGSWHLKQRVDNPQSRPVRTVSRAAERPVSGHRAPDFKLRDLDGQEQRLRELTEGRVTVLTFWLAGCPDCLDSFPKGVALTKAFKHLPVAFVDVAYRGQPEPTALWVRENAISNPVLLDADGSVVGRYGVGTYTCFVLDPKGFIQYRGSVDGAADAVRTLLDRVQQ